MKSKQSLKDKSEQDIKRAQSKTEVVSPNTVY